MLPQVFILGRAAAGRYPFRLVGGLVAELHARDLREDEFLPLWLQQDRASLQSAMEGAARRSHPLVLEGEGRTADGDAVQLEVLLAPLAGNDGAVTRFLGLYQPMTSLARLKGQPIDQLSVRRIGLTAAGPIITEAPRLRLASVDGRRLA